MWSWKSRWVGAVPFSLNQVQEKLSSPTLEDFQAAQ